MSEQVGGAYGAPGPQGGVNAGGRGWLAPVALVVALVATGISIWSLTRSGDGGSPSGAEALSSADAKAKVCSAFETVYEAVRIQTNLDLGPEPVAREAVAANARLATIGGGHYLLHNLEASVPSELRDAIRTFANDLVDVGMGQLAGVPSTSVEQTDRMSYLEAMRPQITELCR